MREALVTQTVRADKPQPRLATQAAAACGLAAGLAAAVQLALTIGYVAYTEKSFDVAGVAFERLALEPLYLVFAWSAATVIAASVGFLAARCFARPIEAAGAVLARSAPTEELLVALSACAPRELIEILGRVAEERRARVELERTVKQLEAELVRITALAGQSGAAKTRFLAHMSHELRTPLNAIMGYTKFLLEDLEGPEHAQSRDDLERVQRASAHLLALINQILDLSKVEAGSLELDLGGFDAGRLVREVLDTAAPIAEAGSTMLVLGACPEGAVIVSDALRFRQCLLNVVGNAVKFAVGGRVEVEAWIEPAGAGRRLVCVVSDDGPGIPEDKLESIFEPFVQIDGEAAAKGTGLGLAITRQLCQRMKGDASCVSAPGEGATFTLAIADLSRKPERAAEEAPPPRASTTREAAGVAATDLGRSA